MIILFQFEGCESSQPVRQRLTELAIDFIAVNAPEKHPEKDQVMVKLFGSAKTPALWDTMAGALVMGREECLKHLDRLAAITGTGQAR
ncbi:MAG: hypothetical protein LLG01_11840 [Planctomycetaceae bacterium]|nr:hypothetical protein [Planctomycetaceae bacterium]